MAETNNSERDSEELNNMFQHEQVLEQGTHGLPSQSNVPFQPPNNLAQSYHQPLNFFPSPEDNLINNIRNMHGDVVSLSKDMLKSNERHMEETRHMVKSELAETRQMMTTFTESMERMQCKNEEMRNNLVDMCFQNIARIVKVLEAPISPTPERRTVPYNSPFFDPKVMVSCQEPIVSSPVSTPTNVRRRPPPLQITSRQTLQDAHPDPPDETSPGTPQVPDTPEDTTPETPQEPEASTPVPRKRKLSPDAAKKNARAKTENKAKEDKGKKDATNYTAAPLAKRLKLVVDHLKQLSADQLELLSFLFGKSMDTANGVVVAWPVKTTEVITTAKVSSSLFVVIDLLSASLVAHTKSELPSIVTNDFGPLTGNYLKQNHMFGALEPFFGVLDYCHMHVLKSKLDSACHKLPLCRDVFTSTGRFKPDILVVPMELYQAVVSYVAPEPIVPLKTDDLKALHDNIYLDEALSKLVKPDSPHLFSPWNVDQAPIMTQARDLFRSFFLTKSKQFKVSLHGAFRVFGEDFDKEWAWTCWSRYLRPGAHLMSSVVEEGEVSDDDDDSDDSDDDDDGSDKEE